MIRKIIKNIFQNKKSAKYDTVIFVQQTLITDITEFVCFFKDKNIQLNKISFEDCNDTAQRLSQDTAVAVAAKILSSRRKSDSNKLVHVVLFDQYNEISDYTNKIKILIGISKVDYIIDLNVDNAIHRLEENTIMHYTTHSHTYRIIEDILES